MNETNTVCVFHALVYSNGLLMCWKREKQANNSCGTSCPQIINLAYRSNTFIIIIIIIIILLLLLLKQTLFRIG